MRVVLWLENIERKMALHQTELPLSHMLTRKGKYIYYGPEVILGYTSPECRLFMETWQLSAPVTVKYRTAVAGRYGVWRDLRRHRGRVGPGLHRACERGEMQTLARPYD